ncbi:MAG: hypothetical protein ABR975_14525 [Vulcanimicrobiaceae bacterium]
MELLDGIARSLFGASASLPDEHDVALFQSVLDSQIRSMEDIDATLSATGALAFSAMTYLLATDEVRGGALLARVLAIALLVPVALIGIAIVRYHQLDAPDLEDLAAELSDDRAAALERARSGMVDAFRANREAIDAKKALRAWSTLTAAALFLTDLLGYVVHWSR